MHASTDILSVLLLSFLFSKKDPDIRCKTMEQCLRQTEVLP